MNEGGENDGLIWEEVWSFLNSNNDQLVGSGEKFAGDKLPYPNRSDTFQPLIAIKEVVEANTAGKKRIPAHRKKDGDGSGEPKSGACGSIESGHEIHIWTERERRKSMRNMFENLHALPPQLQLKADECSIVDEAVNYIKTLKITVEKLENQKLERLQHGIAMLSTMNNSKMTSQKLPSVGTSWEQFLADQGSASNSAAITPTDININNNVSGIPLLNTNIPTGFQTLSSPNVMLHVCGEEAHISVCCPVKPGLFSFICCVLEKHKIDIVSAQVSSDHFRSMFMIQAHARGGSGLDQLISRKFSVEEMYKQAANEIMSMVTPK